MPVWVVAALALLGIVVGGQGGGRQLEGVGGEGIPFLPAFLDPFETGRVVRRRRRRRRALTASDRADIAFIAGLLGQPAGQKFAVTLAARGR